MDAFRRWTWLLAFVALVGANHAWCLAADKEKSADEKTKSKTPVAAVEAHPAFLGVVVEELHPSFASHVPGIGTSGQGLLVQSVSHESPAAKSGIKVHDILMTYDDQKLLSPEQLIKLIAGDRPGREVKIGLIREGKTESLTVTLGERVLGAMESRLGEESVGRRPTRFSWPRNLWRGLAQRPHPDPGAAPWNSFDSMTVKKLDRNRFHASITHSDKDGNLKKHEFEGTRDEIRKRIEADEDLLPNERQHLLRGLDMHGPAGPLLVMPDEDWLDF